MLIGGETWATLFFVTALYAYFTKEERDDLKLKLEYSDNAFKEQKEYIHKLQKELDARTKCNNQNHLEQSAYKTQQYKDDIDVIKTHYENEIKKLNSIIYEMSAVLDIRQTLSNTPFLEWAYQNPDKLTYAEREVILLIQSDKFMSWVKQQPYDKVEQIKIQMKGLFDDVKKLADECKDNLKQVDDNFVKLQELLKNSGDDIMDWIATLPKERQDDIMEIAKNGDYDEMQEIIEEYHYYLNNDEHDYEYYEDEEICEDIETKEKSTIAKLPFKIKEYTTQSINPNDFVDFNAEQMVEVVKKSCFDYICIHDKEAVYYDYNHFEYYNDVFGDFSAECLCLEFGRLIHECVNWLLYYNGGFGALLDAMYLPYKEDYNDILDELFGNYDEQDLANGLQRYIESLIDYYFNF